MCEFILIVFIAVSVLMPKLCFRQRLLKLWSPCKKHPWNESHFTFKSVCSKCKYSLISWEQSRRCKCLPQYCNSYQISIFTRKKNISSVCGFKENPEQCELKVKTGRRHRHLSLRVPTRRRQSSCGSSLDLVLQVFMKNSSCAPLLCF